MTSRTLAAEDLKKGMHVTVIGAKHAEGESAPDISELEGKIYTIHGISLPFLAIEVDNEFGSLDTRHFSLAKLKPNYVNAMLKLKNKHRPPQLLTELLCEKCGDRVVQELIAGIWVYKCRYCNQYLSSTEEGDDDEPEEP